MGNYAYELESVAISLTCKFYLGTVETSSAMGELFWFNVQCIPVVHDICAKKNKTFLTTNCINIIHTSFIQLYFIYWWFITPQNLICVLFPLSFDGFSAQLISAFHLASMIMIKTDAQTYSAYARSLF